MSHPIQSCASGFRPLRSVLTLALLALAPAAFAGNAIEADLAACYAPSYAASVGGEDNAQVLLANTVAGSNQIQDQGGTGAHMRIAGFYQSTNDVINQTTTGGIVNWLSGNSAQLADVVSFGSAVGADLVVYVCQNSDSASIAGVSQQPGYYSSLNPGAVWSAVFAHETGGHAYGRSHSDGVLSPKTIMLHNYCGGGAAPPYFYTNPNIWFNGVQLIGDGVNNCSMGSLVNGGDNSLPSAQAVADRRARVIVGPNLNNVILHWMFTNAPGSAPASTTNYDLVSGAPAIVRGAGATYTGNALRVPGGTTGNVAANSISAYIDLPNAILSSHTNITIEIWATPLTTPNWARIMDFGRAVQAGDGLGAAGEYTGAPGTAAPGTTQSSDDITLSAANGTNYNIQRFEGKLGTFATTLDAGLTTTLGVQHHYAITFTDGAGAAGSAGGRWQWFRDGDAVAFLDVTNHLASMQDVNNWLGRSQWSADSQANNDYAEVRISSVALTRNQILANFLLGPNYIPTSFATLTNSDASGATSFNAAGQWSSGSVPATGKSYETFNFLLNTPPNSSSIAFAGTSLKLSGGGLVWKGTASSTITVTNLTLNSGMVLNSGSGTCTLAGNLNATTNGGLVNAESGAINLTANLAGSGPVLFMANTTTLAGTNTGFTGRMYVGNGQAGIIAIDSLARLGASPTNFFSNQLTLNRGTVQTTATMSLNDTNRGILIDVSGGTFNVASGTTLTVSSALSSPVTASGIIVGSLAKAGAGMLLLNSASNTFKGTLYVDSASTAANDGIVKIASSQVLANAHSPIFIRDNNSGSSTLQLDGSTGNLTLPQALTLNGRSASVPAVENLAGTNTIAGGVTINVGGGNYYFQSDAGLLQLGGQITSLATGTRTLTFQGAGNIAVTGIMTNGSATVGFGKTGAGTLTLSGANNSTGVATVSGGSLFVNGAISNSTLSVTAATLGGSGTIYGATTIAAGSLLMAGSSTNSIGVLTVGNSLTLSAGCTNWVKLNKSAATNDLLNVSGTLTLAGNLSVTNFAGTIVAGDSFKLFNAASYSGAFATTNLPALAAGLAWQNTTVTDGTLRVVAITPPTIASVSVSASKLILRITGGPAGSPFHVLSTTNVALPVAGWTPIWSNNFNSGGLGGYTNPLPATNPWLFYKIAVP